ncbi:hypothetical Protein YC6258_05452 [Gynuella sunshinyii YC6258]|uniref:Uncharacterized protein n=1 Tax=Gynuella sunshinyii YC6258 TaxID=1445510 RepID=A0A0C5VS46_9GAMM|nr:hypothetical Protein YC6258_05452 [Gynuella sunshinyii YC6258]
MLPNKIISSSCSIQPTLKPKATTSLSSMDTSAKKQLK